MPDYWKINKELVKRVASNARLKLSEEEIEKFTKQLSDILSAFKEIDKVDTTKIKASFHPQKIKNVFREDKAMKFEWKPLANTKHKEEKYFKGPRIV
ncbi:MAG: Asp-tRNA(Asn)/Glu-tRNA(Gln) amidotransferase subunit GatC [Candidatus Aenigmarchaeota archaeon]|nr:Asp-tRNA(Asn)/Glu-tRNA(Gln) amidotransferase subunit GatC [Candidatus Aenigmarchaeota archaeon]